MVEDSTSPNINITINGNIIINLPPRTDRERENNENDIRLPNIRPLFSRNSMMNENNTIRSILTSLFPMESVNIDIQTESLNDPQPEMRGVSFDEFQANTTQYIADSSNTNLNDDLCLICSCDYVENPNITRINNCGHKFHTQCLERWLSNHRTCPICRGNIVN
jgi:hypothetical protein